MNDDLAAPGFHHLHLNSLNPEAAIGFYVHQFPSSMATSWGGFPAVKIGSAYLLFTRVQEPWPTGVQTAIWHFGWHVQDVRKNLERYRHDGLRLLPLFRSEQGHTVWVSSDSWPGTETSVGLTKRQIDEAKAKGVHPQGAGGFAYIAGPDGAVVEYQGDMPAERFNHVHMYQEDPWYAQRWYEEHLNARPNEFAARHADGGAGKAGPALAEPSWPALEREGTVRQPKGGVSFDDVALYWYPRPGAERLVGTRGKLVDHIGLRVPDLGDWMAKLRRERVALLEEPYTVGGRRAAMIEGPSGEVLELIEEK